MTTSNFLLIVLDAVRKDHLSCYGHTRKTTPTLDRFAEDATRYTQGISTAPWTPPSHASIFTGQYPSRHRVYGSRAPIQDHSPVLAEELSSAGYATAGFSNSYHTSHDRGFDRGFDYYHDLLELPRFKGRMYEPSLDYLRFLVQYFLTDDDASKFQEEKLKTWIDGGGSPFFGFINFNSAHSPYNPADEYRDRFVDGFDRWDEVDMDTVSDLAHTGGDEYIMDELESTDAEWELVRRWYDAEIAYLDDLLADFFKYLRSQNLYDDTLIIVVSDHGEHFGEQGLAYHKFSLSEILINIPLLIKWPAGTGPYEPGKVSDELVSLVDLAPTILDFADITVPEAMEGRSLAAPDSIPPEAVFAEYGGPSESLYERFEGYERFEQYDRGLQAVRTGGFKLVETTDGESSLYLVGERDEREVDANDYPNERNRFRNLINKELGDLPTRDERHGTSSDKLDEHVREHLQEMGYL